MVNMEEQVDCIVHNLKKCGIRHLDMHLTGKNICVNDQSIISVIDFDIAAIGNSYRSEQLAERGGEVDSETYYTDLRETIIAIINKSLSFSAEQNCAMYKRFNCAWDRIPAKRKRAADVHAVIEFLAPDGFEGSGKWPRATPYKKSVGRAHVERLIAAWPTQ
tara:strand:- start:67 stop:552 length:486 start_codon:yes stop_codon:yes gene_type:complete